MRLLKSLVYLLLVLVLQTVVLARLGFLGVRPDLILVSVVIFAVLHKPAEAVVFAAVAGLGQDVLSFGLYLNTISKVCVSIFVSTFKKNFLGDDYSQVAALVAFITPLLVLFEALLLYWLTGRPLDWPTLLLHSLLGTIYNLILVPLLLPLARGLPHD